MPAPRSAKRPASKPAAPRRGTPAPPRIVAALAVSLDGYIAAPGGAVDWLDPYGDSLTDFPAFLRTVGAAVMGRDTYDFAMSHGPEAASMWGDMPLYVLSHRSIPKARNVTRLSGDVRNIASRLRAECPRGDIWHMGGGRSLMEFLDAGLIDEWRLGVIPVLLGDGIRLFPTAPYSVRPLRLASTRQYRSGALELRYDAAPLRPARSKR